jgi:hypothetical protein
MMEPKAIRVVGINDGPGGKEAPLLEAQAPTKKPPVSYERRLEKMSNRQLRHEIQIGIKGKLGGYNSVVTSVVLDVILDSLDRGMPPFLR